MLHLYLVLVQILTIICLCGYIMQIIIRVMCKIFCFKSTINFPVMYEPVRSKSAVIVANIIKEIMEAYINKLESHQKDFISILAFYIVHLLVSIICGKMKRNIDYYILIVI